MSDTEEDKAADNAEPAGSHAVAGDVSASAASAAAGGESNDSPAPVLVPEAGHTSADAPKAPTKKKKKKKKKKQPLIIMLLPVVLPVAVLLIAVGGTFVYFNMTNQSYKFGGDSPNAAAPPEGVDVSKVKPEDMQRFLEMQRDLAARKKLNLPRPDFNTIDLLTDKDNKAWAAIYRKASKSIDEDVDYAAAEQPLRQSVALARRLKAKRELYLSLVKLELVLNVEKRYGAADELEKEIQSLLAGGKKKEASAAAKKP